MRIIKQRWNGAIDSRTDLPRWSVSYEKVLFIYDVVLEKKKKIL